MVNVQFINHLIKLKNDTYLCYKRIIAFDTV